MNVWDDLVAIAVQGTSRRPPDLSRYAAELGADVAVLGGEPPAALLDAAALATMARRAGALPVADVAPPEPCPAESGPVVPALTRLVEECAGDVALLGELLGGARERRVVLEPAVVPLVLELAATRAELAHVALAACGERGRWLVGQNPAWARLAIRAEALDVGALAGSRAEADSGADGGAGGPGPLDDAPWRTGEPPVRIAWLRAARERDPAQAAEVVTAAMRPGRGGERADVREAIVGLLSETFRPADEPILEAALDDRAVSVRQLAARALAKASDTAYAERMRERGRTWVRFEPPHGLLRRHARVTVAVPDELDAAALRDGIGAGVPKDQPPRPHWLLTVLERTPLATWAEADSPADIVAVDAGAWNGPLREGFLRRAVTEGNHEWADVLLTSGVDAPQRLAGVASPQTQRRLALGLLESPIRERSRAMAVHEVLSRIPHPWPPGVLEAFLHRLPGLVETLGWGSWTPVADAVARGEDVAVLATVEASRAMAVGPTQPLVMRMTRTLHTRARIRRALDGGTVD